MYFRLSLLLLYLPALVSSYNSPQNLNIFPRLARAEVDRWQLRSDLTSIRVAESWVAKGSQTVFALTLPTRPQHNVSLRNPQSVVGSVHRISMGLRARFLGRRLSIHLPIIRSLHYCATRPVGHACKSPTPFFTSIVKR